MSVKKKIAFLMIHGFLANPSYDEYLKIYLDKLRPEFEIFTYTLLGHDKKKIKNITAADWLAQSKEELEAIIKSGYQNIIIYGHSMGGTLATILANEYKDNVLACVLVAPAFNWLRKEDGIKNLVKRFIILFTALFNKSLDNPISFLIKLSPSSAKEFIKLTHEYKNEILNLNIPILLIHGDRDKITPIEFNKEIFEQIRSVNKTFVMLENTPHYIFLSKQKDRACDEINQFLGNVRIKEIN